MGRERERLNHDAGPIRHPWKRWGPYLAERAWGTVREEAGRRAVFGGLERFQTDPAWHDLIPFHEYFHGDNGAGLGAAHQTGWTGLVADLILRRATHRRAAETQRHAVGDLHLEQGGS